MIRKLLIALLAFAAVVYSGTTTDPVTLDDIIANGFTEYTGRKMPSNALTLQSYNSTMKNLVPGFTIYQILHGHAKKLLVDEKPENRAQFCKYYSGWRNDALKHVVKQNAGETEATASLLGLGDVICSGGVLERCSMAAVAISALVMFIL